MRQFRRRLLVYGFPLLEIVTAYAVAQLIGWGWMLLLLIAGIQWLLGDHFYGLPMLMLWLGQKR